MMATILIVEDNEDLVKLYIDILKDANFEVDIASDGKQAVEKLVSQSYDIVLLDIMLPKLDGLQVLKQIPTQAPNFMGKILMLTALDQEDLISEALTLGAVGYLVKSEVTPDRILREIKNLLN